MMDFKQQAREVVVGAIKAWNVVMSDDCARCIEAVEQALLAAYEAGQYSVTDGVHTCSNKCMKITCVQRRKLALAVGALERIIAHSHSWVIVSESAYIEKPIHDSYRSIARECLARLTGEPVEVGNG